ncbi:unnamed protein product [Urochloa decumbens]|uniref:CCHC-type domain-containing protein n=1 Tax=Urochloa decumbens TaxID=240449 RepID=A0ABC9BWN5_9POAL
MAVGYKADIVAPSLVPKGPSHRDPSLRHADQSPPLPHPSQSERSIAFKRWAQGRCYRCLARDHQVSSCRSSFRCIRCRCLGHRERRCPLRAPSPAPRAGSSSMQSHHQQQTGSWADMVAMPSSADTAVGPPSSGICNLSPTSQPTSSCEKDIDPICHSCCCASPASISSSLQSMVTSLIESLQSELQQLIAVRLEEVVRPLQEEVSTTKLWLARVAHHLERAETSREHSSVPDMSELFGPCSPIRHSLMSSILTSLAAARTPTNSLVRESFDSETFTKQPIEVPASVSSAQKHPDPTNELKLVQAVSSVEEFVIVEDASDDEEAISDARVTVEDPIFLITIEHDPIQSVVEVKKDEPQLMEDPPVHPATTVEEFVLVEDASDDEEAIPYVYEAVEDPIFLVTIEDGPAQSALEVKEENVQLIDDSLIQSATGARKGEACLPIYAPSPPKMTTKCRRKSYDRSSLRRSARLAQRGVLKDLGIIGNDGKLNDDAIQDCADRLKELLPPDLLGPLMSLKGRAFWDFVAKISLPLR